MTIWEQLDHETMWTPTRKVFTAIPIVLTLLAIHYNDYSPVEFALNIFALLIALIPKLPGMHLVRLFDINST